ncbi:hypothetical protein OXYTRIMIC_447 [Oxytricha trifallax]|uniref:Uncharacterized protein n=1 Tax=Oxytricha trifallax TaxID=1172189 RepID=A0A073HZI9_9SPIT|nr:hypothetical protein OXYTRIMIC_447 [Oxytricha trifallax]
MHIKDPNHISKVMQNDVPKQIMNQMEQLKLQIILDQSLRLQVYKYLTLNKNYGCISNLSKAERLILHKLKDLVPESKLKINLQQCPMILTELELLMRFSYNYIIIRNSTHNSNAYIYYDYFILKIPKGIGQLITLEIQNTSTQLYDTCFRSIQQWQDRHKTSFKKLNLKISNTSYTDALLCQNLMKNFKDINIDGCVYTPKIKDLLLQLIQAEKENNQAKITELTPQIQTYVNQESQATNQIDSLKIESCIIIDNQICDAFKTVKILVLNNTFLNQHCFKKLSDLKQIETFKCVGKNLSDSTISKEHDQQLKTLLTEFDFKLISNFSQLKKLTATLQKNQDLIDLMDALKQIENKEILVKLIFNYPVQLTQLIINFPSFLNYQSTIICPKIVFVDQALPDQVKNDSIMKIFSVGIPQFLEETLHSSSTQSLKVIQFGKSDSNNLVSQPQAICSLKFEITVNAQLINQNEIQQDNQNECQNRLLLMIQKYKDINLDIKIIG